MVLPEKTIYFQKSETVIKYLLISFLIFFPLAANPFAESPDAAFLPIKTIFMTLWNLTSLIYLLHIKRYPSFEKSDVFLVVFLILSITSTLLNGDLENKLINPSRSDGWLTWFNYCLLYINVSSLSKNVPREFLFKFWPFAVLPAATLIFFQGYFGTPDALAHLNSDGFPGGTFGNRASFGGYASLLAIPGLIWAAGSGPVGLLCFGFFGWVIGLIQVRGAWVAIALGFTLSLVLIRNQNLKRTVVVFMLGFGLAIAVPPKQFSSNLSSGDDGRFVLWKTGIQAILERPLFGWGVGGFAQAFPDLADWRHDPQVRSFLLPKPSQKIFASELIDHPAPLSKKITYGNQKIQYTVIEKLVIDKAHNEYLDVSIAFGLPAFLLWFTWVANRILRFFRHGQSGMVYSLSLITICIFYAFWMNSIAFAPFLWFVSGFFRNPTQKLNDHKQAPPKNPTFLP
jgi:O-antigen ligase